MNLSNARHLTLPRGGGAARLYFIRVQRELLHPPVKDFSNIQFIVFAAIHLVYSAEFLQLFAARAELAENGAIELHFVDRSGIKIAGVGIGAVKILVRPGGDAKLPRCADVRVLRL